MLYSDEEKLSEVLIRESEPIEQDFMKRGSFVLEENGFILCKGRYFQGPSARSRTSFDWNGEYVDNLGKLNNQAVLKILSKKEENLSIALEILNKNVQLDPVFFATRYNLGKLNFILKNYKEAEIHFLKARDLIPNYHKTYLYLAKIYSRLNQKSLVLENLTKSHALNEFDFTSLFYLAELSFKDGLETKSLYYIEEIRYKNSLQGKLAKAIYYYWKEDYSKSYSLFKQIPWEDWKKNQVEYVRVSHFYFAEASIKVLDKKTAREEYLKLLEFPFETHFDWIDKNYINKRIELNTTDN